MVSNNAGFTYTKSDNGQRLLLDPIITLEDGCNKLNKIYLYCILDKIEYFDCNNRLRASSYY